MADIATLDNRSGFDIGLGFTVTNNTSQNIYLQTSAADFELITPGNESKARLAFGNFPVRNNGTTNSGTYLTVNVSASDGSVNLVSGTLRGNIGVTVNFA